MASVIGVLVVHGIGVQEKDFADDFISEMNDRLIGLQVAPDAVVWQPAYWADLLNDRELKLWNDLSRDHDLDWVTVRQFFINFFADAIAYQRKLVAADDMYRQIHNRIHGNLAELRSDLGGQDKLGTNPFERMETLASIVTFGSNIPLFTLALDKIECITFPPPTLPANLKAKAKWLNLFDGDDVLGYPLKPLSPSYTQTVTADLQINAGGLFASWNPISHTEYWTDNDFTKPVAQLISDLVKA
jgi:hypothetical protein